MINQIKIWIISGMTCSILASPALARKVQSDDLSNMIIEGESRLRVQPQLPESSWKPETTKTVAMLLQDAAVIGELKPPAIQHPPLNLIKQSATEKAASPWLARITEAPLFTLSLKGQKEKKGRQDWVLLIKDSRGKTFREIKGRGEIPDQLEWDGFGNANEPLRVGFDYTYSLSVLDEAGNPQRFAGKPFRVNSFRYRTTLGRTVMIFEPDFIFESPSSAKISDDGKDFLVEAKDFIRRDYGKDIDLMITADDAGFAKSRAEILRKFFVQSLDWPDERVTANIQPRTKGGGYDHVDIIVR